MNSFLRGLGARLTPRGGSGYLHLFGHSRNGGATKTPNSEPDPESADVLALKALPEIAEGVHQMRTARAFISRGKYHTNNMMDDEE